MSLVVPKSLIWHSNNYLVSVNSTRRILTLKNEHSLVVDVEMSLISQFSLPLCGLFPSTPVASGFIFWEAYSSVAHF
jgi:hypothetical protein